MICASDHKVIASAPSNAATANIALKLFETSRFHHLDLCVYGNSCEKSVHFLNPSLRKDRYRLFLKKFGDESNEGKSKALLRNFCTWLHISPDSSLAIIRSICDASEDDDYLQYANVICCTLNSSGSPWLRKRAGERGTFYLDEAGQCNEAEFYLATSFPRIERIVVVGDPKQLPPTTIDMGCKDSGLGVSWMEKVFSLSPSNVHLLDTQYRMDPIILKFPNREFYSNRIKSGKCTFSRVPKISKPIGFVDTSNRSWEERENFSTKNAQEASIIRALLRQDRDIQALLHGQPESTVVVISPYAAQVDLLKSELAKVKNIRNWSVATVDSYQGQEADIVILSTVRTERIGFVDDPQRLNVALTRAKRLVRVIGCKKLFDKLGRRSTLNRLVSYLCFQNCTVDANVKNIVYSFPDWRKPSKWKPACSQRFYNCLRQMSLKQKAVTMSTLQAVTIPNLRDLYQHPSRGFWQLSSLRGHSDCNIVWVAKDDYTIETHFAGTRKDCLQFLQKNISNIPMGSCQVTRDLSSVKDQYNGTSSVTPSWDLSNFLQKAIQIGTITELPEGSFHLDPEQQAIVSSRAPLLLESRSGTGKTNVLFQHAISTSQELAEESVAMPVAFITVSKLLRSQLEQMYQQIKDINNEALQSCVFMSLSDLLDGLAKRMGLKWNSAGSTSFKEYILARKSYSSLTVDSSLIENEIGGVIQGSLRSALLTRSLTRKEYQNDPRSNVRSKDEQGSSIRHIIYDNFELYDKWKRENDFFDVNDMVLDILKKLVSIDCSQKQIFAAVYLDEIQDFSYAMIFLICSIGGTSNLNWVFAGDTAQMISPGCSFTFAGLKQTLLSIRPGIESQLKQVAHLLINYRTTKDVLQVGNAILAKAKEHFPGAIEFARKEEAVNNFGLKVVLNDWDSALETKPSFGKDQALVYSFSNDRAEDDSYASLKHWLDDHPFILSCVDSKGLEFDDIVVAFDLDRACWKAESQEAIALNMLRELYVAVTRAKRRVVILVKKGSDTMLKFFTSLDYELNYHADTNKLFNEFNTSTSKEQWLQRADDLFAEERYRMSSRCYEKSESPALAAYARGKHFAKQRLKPKAASEYIRASGLFYDLCSYKKILDIASDMLLVVSWDSKTSPEFILDEHFRVADSNHPMYLGPSVRRKIDILHDRWDRISLEHIETELISVMKRRGYPGLMKHLQGLSDFDINKISNVIPCIVGDLMHSREQYLDAINLYLQGRDFHRAEETSLKLVHILKKQPIPTELLKLEEVWSPHQCHLTAKRSDRTISLLFSLVSDPEKAAQNNPLQCLDLLGARAIRFIVSHKGLDPICLYDFCQETFHKEVLKELKRNHKEDPGQIVAWFLTRDNPSHAIDFMLERLSEWKIVELRSFIRLDLIHEELAQEFCNRGYSEEATKLFIKCRQPEKAFSVANGAVSSVKGAEKYALRLMVLLQRETKPKQPSHRMNLLNQLFNQPHIMEKKCLKESIKAFGPSVIKEFVLRRTSYYRTITKKQINGKDEEVQEYIDVLAVLGTFGTEAKMSRREVLQNFQQRNIISQANDFIEYHMKDWTLQDLFDITDKFGYRNKTLAAEFRRRKRYTKAAVLYFDAKCILDAANASDDALSSPGLATQNATEVRKIWLTDNNQSKYRDVQTKLRKESRIYLFLLLFQDPQFVATTENECLACVHHFEPSVIQLAVLTSYFINPELFRWDPVQILSSFENSGAKMDISKLDFLRRLNAMSREQNHAAKIYAWKHIGFWSTIIGSLQDDDIRIFLDPNVNVQPNGIESALSKRNMHLELVQVYLDKKRVTDAISSSNDALKGNASGNRVEELVAIWEDTSDAHISMIHQNSKLGRLLQLFKDPVSISKSKLCSRYISSLGFEIVEIAVKRNVVEKEVGDVLRAFDPKEFSRYGREDEPRSNLKPKTNTKKGFHSKK